MASTTRSAGSTEEAAPSRLGMIVTPVTRWPRPADARPTASQPATICTPGRAATRVLITSSSSGRLATSPGRPDGAGHSRWPSQYQCRSCWRSTLSAPAWTASSVKPGSRSSTAAHPAASKLCACRPCGTPRRIPGLAGMTSRSTSVTWS